MKYIAWGGCLGFAMVVLFQNSVIRTMEDSYMKSYKYNCPIIKQPKESKTIEPTSFNVPQGADYGSIFNDPNLKIEYSTSGIKQASCKGCHFECKHCEE